MSGDAETLGFGARLRHHRLVAGLTQAALAERAGLSTRGIQHLEAGEARPYRQTLERLARALDLAPEEQARLDAVASARPRLTALRTVAGRSDRTRDQDTAGAPVPLARVQRKTVTVLCAGIANFHALGARLDPTSLDALLDEWVRLVVREVEHYGGTVYQVQTAEVVALFGAPLALADHAARALLAAVHLREVVAGYRDVAAHRWQVAPHLRIGVATGPTVVRLADEDFMLEEPSAEGPAAIAAVLQRYTPHDTIWASEATQRLAPRAFVWQSLGPLALRGHPSRLPASRLVRLAPASEPFAVEPHGRPTRFVGRQAECELLAATWERARAGHGGVLLLSGAPGSGKSRLLHEFARQIEGDGGRALTVCCTPQADRAPYRPFLQLVAARYGLAQPPADAAARAQLAEWLRGLPGLPAAAQVRLGELLGVGRQDERAGGLPPERLRQEYALALKQCFLAAARCEPLALIVDNAQDLDRPSIAVVGLLAEAIADVGSLLVLAYRALPACVGNSAGPAAPLADPRRAALLRALAAGPTTVSVALGDLSVADSGTMLAALLANTPRPADLDAQIVRRASGNPLYVEALAAACLDDGALAPDAPTNGFLPMPASLPARVLSTLRAQVDSHLVPPLPDRIVSTLLAQVDRLPPPLPAVLQAAAALGPTFSGAALARLVPSDAVADQALFTLESLGLLRTTALAPEWRYAFTDALLQQAVASTLTAPLEAQPPPRDGALPWPATLAAIAEMVWPTGEGPSAHVWEDGEP